MEVVPQTYHGLGQRGQYLGKVQRAQFCCLKHLMTLRPIVLIRTGGIDPASFNKLSSAGHRHAVSDAPSWHYYGWALGRYDFEA